MVASASSVGCGSAGVKFGQAGCGAGRRSACTPALLATLQVVSAGTTDYDSDDDGLIEVVNLAQLHAVRYDLNGDGLLDVAANWPEYNKVFPRAVWDMGCPNGCGGYELTANLDFDTNASGGADADDAYWNEGAGWTPIGHSADRFAGTFEGNRHTLANLLDKS